MTRDIQATSVHMQVVVEAPADRAFAVFTEGIGTWFPPEYNLLAVPIAERVFEPHVGGRVYDRGVDGSECQWARVLVYERPHRVVISWDISPRWQIEADRMKTSEVEVHRHLERHGDGWERERDELGAEGGWPGCLGRFAERLKASA